MTERPPANVVASIHQRLLNVARQTGRLFNDLVLYYAIERFLYRLSQSPYADRVVLTGALMLQVWQTPITRLTRDIDLLGRMSNDLETIHRVVAEVCAVPVEADGLDFDASTVTTQLIAEDADYQGVRAQFRGHFGKTPLAMQIDFGFSDTVSPSPIRVTYPTILDHPPAELLAYNRETAIAEKFEAMVKLGEANSRMKDFFDVWLLARTFAFDGTVLAEAVRSTFARRGATVNPRPACFDDRFIDNPTKSAQWNGFIRRSRLTASPVTFRKAVEGVREFLQAIAATLSRGATFEQRWPAGGPWV